MELNLEPLSIFSVIFQLTTATPNISEVFMKEENSNLTRTLSIVTQIQILSASNLCNVQYCAVMPRIWPGNVTTTMSSGPRVFCNAAFHHITAHLLLCLYHSVVLVVSHIWLAASGHRDKVISHCTIFLKFIDNCLDFQLTNK